MAANTVIPTPPRLTGDPTTDVQLLHGWINDFYRAAVLESKLLDPAFQANAGTFNPNDLPSPANSSIAKAQDTANRAYQLAAAP